MGSVRSQFSNRWGKQLRVDLAKGKFSEEDIREETIRNYIGGVGLAAKILFAETGPQTDPLSPDNIVIISAGLLNGTGAPTACRTEVTTKSPLTGIIGSGNTGGSFGSMLRKAGYETILITGAAKRPAYLAIDDGKIELKSASHLWGSDKDSWETTDAIKKEMGEDFSVMAIGQAGENLVKFACPVVDYYHAPARSHAGCVMGSKNLKAIAVRGSKEIPASASDSFKKVSDEITERIKNYPARGLQSKIGTLGKQATRRGGFGAKHFQVGTVPDSNDLWRPENFMKYLIPGPPYCGTCPLSYVYGCNATADVKEGKYEGLYMEGIAFSNTVAQWGAKCAIESFPAMIKCKEACNRYGIDQDNPIPFALELCQRGIVTKEDLGGNELRWGDEEAILEMLGNIAHRRGFGNTLAEGSARAAQIIGRGAEKYVLNLKGMELLPGEDPRSMGISTSLGHLICARGGDDLKTTHAISENMPGWARKQGWKQEDFVRWIVDRLDMFDEVKGTIYGTPPHLDPSSRSLGSIAAMTKWYEDISAIRDSLGVCLFATNSTNAIGIEYCMKLFSSYLGFEISANEMMVAAERIVNLMKAYNVREGLTRDDDHYPPRFYTEPLDTSGDGTAKGPVLSKEYINQLLNTYYELRGWDKQTGSPTEKGLRELGLGFVADELLGKNLL